MAISPPAQVFQIGFQIIPVRFNRWFLEFILAPNGHAGRRVGSGKAGSVHENRPLLERRPVGAQLVFRFRSILVT